MARLIPPFPQSEASFASFYCPVGHSVLIRRKCSIWIKVVGQGVLSRTSRLSLLSGCWDQRQLKGPRFSVNCSTTLIAIFFFIVADSLKSFHFHELTKTPNDATYTGVQMVLRKFWELPTAPRSSASLRWCCSKLWKTTDRSGAEAPCSWRCGNKYQVPRFWISRPRSYAGTATWLLRLTQCSIG